QSQHQPKQKLHPHPQRRQSPPRHHPRPPPQQPSKPHRPRQHRPHRPPRHHHHHNTQTPRKTPGPHPLTPHPTTHIPPPPTAPPPPHSRTTPGPQRGGFFNPSSFPEADIPPATPLQSPATPLHA